MSQIRDPETIEEELELFAEAVRLGIDPFPPKRVRGRRSLKNGLRDEG